ncbi:MAG TPA: hypothetical protein VML01_11915 [Bryobacterales bacterium]|nr:hypothetical protein [Bryobacterales bacterium]
MPKPRAHLTRYHGIFAPNSAVRALLVAGRKAGRGTGKEQAEQTDAKRHRAMTWVQRLKRVFHIEIEICRRCGGKLRVIASIEEPQVIERILNHLGRDSESLDLTPPSRAPPQRGWPISPPPRLRSRPEPGPDGRIWPEQC